MDRESEVDADVTILVINWITINKIRLTRSKITRLYEIRYVA